MGQILGNHRGHGRVGVGDAPDVLQRRINSLERQLQESKRRESRLANDVRDRERRITELQSTVDWSNRERSQVVDHNMQLQRDLSAKEEIISPLRAQVENLESQVTARDWVINKNDIHVTDHELGSGAWGTVCKGRFRGCDVAVKKMHEAINETGRSVFEREVNMASKCRHPCLLFFIGATTDERPLLVTELLECSLRNKLFPSPGELPVENESFISLDVAYALLYLHEKANPILHNDVSYHPSKDGKSFFEFWFYKKKAKKPLFVHHESTINGKAKTNFIRNERKRIQDRCSTQTATNTKHQGAFDEILPLNGYSESCIHHTKQPQNRREDSFPSNTEWSYLKIPYISERLDYKITTIFRKEGIPVRIARKSYALRKAFSHKITECTCTRDNWHIAHTKLCFLRNAVYQIRCKDCYQHHIRSSTRFT